MVPSVLLQSASHLPSSSPPHSKSPARSPTTPRSTRSNHAPLPKPISPSTKSYQYRDMNGFTDGMAVSASEDLLLHHFISELKGSFAEPLKPESLLSMSKGL